MIKRTHVRGNRGQKSDVQKAEDRRQMFRRQKAEDRCSEGRELRVFCFAVIPAEAGIQGLKAGVLIMFSYKTGCHLGCHFLEDRGTIVSSPLCKEGLGEILKCH